MNDDFFVGISKHKLFVTKYRVETPRVSCFTDEEEKIGSKYLYTVYYNTSQCLRNPEKIDSECK
jgi:hypothetical protein